MKTLTIILSIGRVIAAEQAPQPSNLLPIILTGVAALFGGAAAAALVTGIFTRPKIRAEAVAAVAAAQAASASASAATTTADAGAAKAIQEAAAGLVTNIQAELARVRDRCDRNERRLAAAEQWRLAVDELLEEHARWDAAVAQRLRECGAVHDFKSGPIPQPPPLRPTPAQLRAIASRAEERRDE